MPDKAEIERNNRLLLQALSVFLCAAPDSITAAEVDLLSAECSVDKKRAYSLLLATSLGLDLDQPREREFYEAYFPEMLQILDPAAFLGDPYLRSIRFPTVCLKDWELKQLSYAPYEAFVCGESRFLPDGRLLPAIGCFDQAFPYPAALQNGREWMTVTPNEIVTMAPVIERAHGRVLTYGLGLGYFAYMASCKAEVASVDIVERDASAIALFKRCLLPQFPHGEKLHIHCADAFAFAEESGGSEYDLVFTDLWHDPADGVALYLRMKELEHLHPESEHHYWIENTLRCYL